MASASQIPKRNLGRQSRSPRPTGATLAVCSNGPMYLRHGFRRPNFVPKFGASVMGIGPYEREERLPQPPWPAAQSGASAARMGGRGGDRGRNHPQSVRQPWTIPQSRPLAAPAPFAQGSLGLRGTRRTSPGHRSSQQPQAGRDRARPLQKGGEYAEGWGDKRPRPVRDLPGHRRPRFLQGEVFGMTAGAKASSYRPTSQRPS